MATASASSKSAIAIWSSALLVGSYLGYTTPPFKIIRSYIESRNNKYIEKADSSPLVIESNNELQLSDSTQSHQQLQSIKQTLRTSSSALLEHELMNLPLVKGLKNDPALSMRRAWSGPHYETLPGETPWRKGQVFTANTLHQPGGIAAKPVVFTNTQTKSATIVLHVGHRVTGFPAIVHGGVLATLLDEALGRTAFLSFPESTGVTANLKIKYKNPTWAHQFIVIKTETSNVDGRKATVKGKVETLQGKILVEAEALFVVPKKFQLKRIE